jgi:hypothetical protein
MDWLLNISVFMLGVYAWYTNIHRPEMGKRQLLPWWLPFLAYAIVVIAAMWTSSYPPLLPWLGGGAVLGGLSGAFANDWAKGKWRFWHRQGSK